MSRADGDTTRQVNAQLLLLQFAAVRYSNLTQIDRDNDAECVCSDEFTQSH